MRVIGKVVGRDRESLRLYVAEHLLRIDVFRGGGHEQRRASGEENEPSYPRLRASPCRIRPQLEGSAPRRSAVSSRRYV